MAIILNKALGAEVAHITAWATQTLLTRASGGQAFGTYADNAGYGTFTTIWHITPFTCSLCSGDNDDLALIAMLGVTSKPQRQVLGVHCLS